MDLILKDVEMQAIIASMSPEELEQLQKTIEKQKLQLFSQTVKTYINNVVHLGIKSDDKTITLIQKLGKRNAKMRKEKVTTNYYWLTVTCNPNWPDATLGLLQTKANKFANRSLIDGALYVFEWTKTGIPHIHMLIYQTKNSTSKMRSGAESTFKDCATSVSIKMKPIPENWVEDKIDYIFGFKYNDPDGQKKVMVDDDYIKRVEENLDHYYISKLGIPEYEYYIMECVDKFHARGGQ